MTYYPDYDEILAERARLPGIGVMQAYRNVKDRQLVRDMEREDARAAIKRFIEMDAAHGDMLANATKFDGSYEAARDRFNALARQQESVK